MLSTEQLTNLTGAITTGATDYFGIMVAVAAIIIPIAWAVSGLMFAMKRK